jgi:hypothetical protein
MSRGSFASLGEWQSGPGVMAAGALKRVANNLK